MMAASNVRKRIFPCLAAVAVMAAGAARAATYYVSESSGNDAWSGRAAEPDGKKGPWKTLKRASIKYVAGDRILLKCGDTWNEELRPEGSGSSASPILIGSYGKGGRPIIDRQDDKQDRSGIHLIDQEGFKIVGIEFARCMTGIFAEYSAGSPNRKYLWIENCRFRDSLHYQHYEDYPVRKIGLGICLFSHERKNTIAASDITVKSCEFRRLASGIWTNNPDNFNKNAPYLYNFGDFVIEDCLFEGGYQWQLGMRGIDGGAVRRCVTHDIGRNFRSFNGVAGAMFFRCKNWVFEDSEWGYISIGLGSGDGEAFDFEGNCDNMTMRNCLFHDTDGPCFLICCYASGPQPNRGILMENCVLNGKSKRPIGLPRCEIVNTTDWNEAAWRNCRFFLSPGEALMAVMDPEKEKRSSFHDCLVKNLGDACSTPNLAARGMLTASTQVAGGEAPHANDANAATAWIAEAATDQWLQLEFPTRTTINEFKIREDSSSSISRYAIEYWDDKTGRWASCFHGAGIGAEFIAPIVTRNTSKVRLSVMRTDQGRPAIAEFEAYHDTTGGLPHDKLGKVLARTPARTVAAIPAKPPFAPGAVTSVAPAKSTFPATSPVGNPGNKADTTGYGAVAYEYRIGKYEVTNAEFREFLNAVAKTDAHDLYDPRMAGQYGGITRSGESGNYRFATKPGMDRKPVNYVTWETALRYANWLTSGDTEKGSYAFEGPRAKVPEHAALAAGKTTSWVLSSENEWYKAAYYDPDKPGGAGYWRYATKSNEVPQCNINSDAPSDVGGFAPSPYGTHDQNGNMWEYNDHLKTGKVGLRGGSFYLNDNETYLRSSTRYDVLSAKWPNYGFRVVALGGATRK